MNKMPCYIRQNRNRSIFKAFPWTLEVYPNNDKNKIFHRRDFSCRNIGECWRVAYATCGDVVDMNYDKTARRSYNKRWKEIFG